MPRYIVRSEATQEVHDAIEAVLEAHPQGKPGRVERHYDRTPLYAPDEETACARVRKTNLRRALAEVTPEDGAELTVSQAILNATTEPYEIVSVIEG